MDLTIRKTLIGGDTLNDDYCVIHDGRRVGRIRLAEERSWQGVCRSAIPSQHIIRLDGSAARSSGKWNRTRR
jgi:hypothetical protein